MSNEHTSEMLQELQAMPLEAKILLSKARIHEFYSGYNNSKGYGNVYISYSGGKDSSVLLHLVRSCYPDVPAVFVQTGLEYPEIVTYAKNTENTSVVYPEINFLNVIRTYGYPLISKEVSDRIAVSRQLHRNKWVNQCRNELTGKRIDAGKKSLYNKEKWFPLVGLPLRISAKCCYYLKKRPVAKYEKKNQLYPFIGTLAEESMLRKNQWMRYGCNSFTGKIASKPLSFWREQDILQYIIENDIGICSVYGHIESNGTKLACTGCSRTGCVYCGFGLHRECGLTRFQRLSLTHPRLYEYCLNGGEWIDNPDYDYSLPANDDNWVNWNPKRIWQPNERGLGMRVVFDMINSIYGPHFYRYD